MFALLNTLNVLWLAKLVSMVKSGDRHPREQQLVDGAGQPPGAAAVGKATQHAVVEIAAYAGSAHKND